MEYDSQSSQKSDALEKIKSTIIGTDEPMEVEHPTATPILMMGFYFILLLAFLALASAYFGFSRIDRDKAPQSTPATNSAENQNER